MNTPMLVHFLQQKIGSLLIKLWNLIQKKRRGRIWVKLSSMLQIQIVPIINRSLTLKSIYLNTSNQKNKQALTNRLLIKDPIKRTKATEQQRVWELWKCYLTMSPPPNNKNCRDVTKHLSLFVMLMGVLTTIGPSFIIQPLIKKVVIEL